MTYENFRCDSSLVYTLCTYYRKEHHFGSLTDKQETTATIDKENSPAINLSVEMLLATQCTAARCMDESEHLFLTYSLMWNSFVHNTKPSSHPSSKVQHTIISKLIALYTSAQNQPPHVHHHDCKCYIFHRIPQLFWVQDI